MKKDYEIKLYDIDGTFIKTVERENVISNISFSGAIESGNSEVKVELPVNSETVEMEEGQVMKLIVFSDNYPNGKTIFTGVCTISEYRIGPDGEYRTMTYLGIQYLLAKMFYKVWGNFTGTATATPGQIIKDIIDFYNGVLGYSWFSTANIDLTGSSISLDVDYTYCMNLIKDASKTKMGYYLYIDGTGAVYFSQKSATPQHLLTLGGDVDSIVYKKDLETMVNGHIVEWSWGTRPENVDATSQSNYFVSQLKENRTELKNTGTADAYSAAYIDKYKNPTSRTTVSVNINFTDGENITDWGIEELIPGHTVTILNTNDVIENLQIHKITYNIRGVELELEAIQTLWFLLSN